MCCTVHVGNEEITYSRNDQWGTVVLLKSVVRIWDVFRSAHIKWELEEWFLKYNTTY